MVLTRQRLSEPSALTVMTVVRSASVSIGCAFSRRIKSTVSCRRDRPTLYVYKYCDSNKTMGRSACQP